MIFQRRGWLAFGLGVSMAFHAFLAFWLAPAPLPEHSPAPGTRDAEAIEFQVVPIAGRDTPPPAPVRPKRGGRVNGPAAHPVAVAVSMAAPTPASASGDAPGTGDEAAAPAAAMPSGGTGAGSPSSTVLLMARLSAAALRCYPQEAVRFRLAGQAQLSFCLNVEGQASSVKLSRSSGSEVLDRAAAECVLPGALPLPGAAGCYELPVRFAARQR
jgi:protein TonB